MERVNLPSTERLLQRESGPVENTASRETNGQREKWPRAREAQPQHTSQYNCASHLSSSFSNRCSGSPFILLLYTDHTQSCLYKRTQVLPITSAGVFVLRCTCCVGFFRTYDCFRFHNSIRVELHCVSHGRPPHVGCFSIPYSKSTCSEDWVCGRHDSRSNQESERCTLAVEDSAPVYQKAYVRPNVVVLDGCMLLGCKGETHKVLCIDIGKHPRTPATWNGPTWPSMCSNRATLCEVKTCPVRC